MTGFWRFSRTAAQREAALFLGLTLVRLIATFAVEQFFNYWNSYGKD